MYFPTGYFPTGYFPPGYFPVNGGGVTPDPPSGATGVQLVRGPIQLLVMGQVSQSGVVGDVLPLLCHFCDDNGTILSLSGVTLMGTLTRFGSVVASAVSAPVVYGDTSQFRVNVTLPQQAGVCRLTMTRNAGGGDVQSAQIEIEVLAK